MVDETDREVGRPAPPATTDGTDVQVVDPATDEPVAARPTRSRSSRLPWVVATVAVLVAVATAVVALLLVTDARRTTADIAAVEQTSGEFALALTNWDASAGMAATREELRAAGTESFAADLDDLFGGTDDLAALAELGTRSSGEVRDVLVQRLDGDEAVALAVVVQRVTTDVTDGEEVSLRYAELTLLRDGGTWRIEQVDLIVDALQEAANRNDLTELPGFGELDTGDTSGEDDTSDEDAP